MVNARPCYIGGSSDEIFQIWNHQCLDLAPRGYLFSGSDEVIKILLKLFLNYKYSNKLQHLKEHRFIFVQQCNKIPL